MNRKLPWFALGLLGLLGLSNVSKCMGISENVYRGCLEEIVEIEKAQVVSIETDVERLRYEIDAGRLDSKYQLTAKDLIFLARLVYHEEGSLLVGRGKGFTDEEIVKGYEAVASVLLNRFEFDNRYNTTKFHNSGIKLIDYALKEGQFDAIKNYPDSFTKESLKDKNGKLTLGSNPWGQQSREVVYNALVRVLSGKVEDRTFGSLYYKTKRLGENGKVVWHGTEAFWLNDYRCNLDWNANITDHQYYGVDCGVE